MKTQRTMGLAALCTGCAVSASTASAEDREPSQSVLVQVDGVVGFPTTDMEIEAKPKSLMLDAKAPTRPALGAYAGASYPVLDWLSLDGGAALLFWKTEAMDSADKDREKLLELTVKPRFRYTMPQSPAEVYVGLSGGVSLPLVGDAFDKASGGTAEGSLGYVAGAHLGGYYFFESRIGIHYEFGYQRHWFTYDFDTKPAASLDFRYDTVNVSLGAAYAF